MVSGSRLRFVLLSLVLAGAFFMAMRWSMEPRPAVPAPYVSSQPVVTHNLFPAAGPAISVFPAASGPVEGAAICESGAAPGWAVPFGREFWRSRLPAPSIGITPRADARLLPARQLADAIERISHVFQTNAQSGRMEANGQNYRATIDAQGVGFLRRGADAETALIRFRTQRILQGSECYYGPVFGGQTWYCKGDTAQGELVPGMGLVEHYEARSDGLEVAWVLSRQPAGAGALVIEAELAGAQFAGAGSASNGDSSMPRVKVGQAQVVDHDGRTWPLTVQFGSNQIRVEVPTEVLAAAAYPIAIDPLLTPEFGLDSVAQGTSPATRAAPVVTANEAGYLVVWSQGKGECADPAVYAARVDRAGVLLDPYGIVVSPLAAEQTVCAVAANSNLYLVAWSLPHGTSTTDWDIVGARILPTGAVLDPVPLPLCTVVTSVQNSPAVASGGDNFLVAWRDSRNTGIYGAIVRADGTISPTNGLSLLNGANDQYAPAVAALGTNFLVVAQDYRRASSTAYYSDIYGARVSASGALLDPVGFLVCTNSGSQLRPAVAADGTNYLVVWQDYDLGGGDILGARVDPGGTVLDTNAIVISHAVNSQASPTVAGGENGFLVAWQDYRDSGTNNYAARIYAARVQGDASVLDPEGVPLSSTDGGQHFPSVTTWHGDWLVVWQDFRNNPGTLLSDIYGAHGTWSNLLAVSAEGLISGAGPGQVSPTAAALGANFLAVWADKRHSASNDWDICGVRLDGGGALLDSEPIWICTATNRQSDPTVTAGQTNYFVAWSDWRNVPPTIPYPDIYGTVVGADGIVNQPDGIPICTVTNDQSLPSSAYLGTNFFVVWQDARLTAQPAVRVDIYGARITATGALLDPAGFAICTNVLVQTNPVVAANASRALVAWTDHRYNSVYPDMFGNRVAADGTVLDTNGFPICLVGASSQYLPAVASDGTNFLVAWTDTRVAATAPDIYGALVNSDGAVTPVAGFAIRAAAGPQIAPAVAFNGRDYLVSWQEARATSINAWDVFAVQLDPSGVAGPVLAINTNLDLQTMPTLASAPDGRFLVAYQSSAFPGRHIDANLLNSESIPRLDAVTVVPGGTVQFRFRGAVGERYTIEASDDFRVWTPLVTFTNSSPAQTISDPATTNYSARYYRAVLLP